MQLHEIAKPKGATKKRKRRGRGESSGLGKTAGRGGKGQTARTGKGKPGAGFEGGQMPMYRRLPKRGFKNARAAKMVAVNLDRLAGRFAAGEVIDLAAVKRAGLAGGRIVGLRVLSRGEPKGALHVRAIHVTPEAKRKIEAAGGQVEIVVPGGEV